MTDPQKPASWWQTLPGILTGLAAFITAISGLIALLYQNGFLEKKSEQANPSVTAAANSGNNAKASDASPSSDASTAANPATSTTPAPTSSPNRKAWSDVEAVITIQDGTQVRVRADSLSNCISVNHELTLGEGQSIAFERMSGFEVVQADDHTSSNAKAKIKVTLLSGSSVSGTVEANCDLFGNNEAGRFTTYFDRIRSIHFEY